MQALCDVAPRCELRERRLLRSAGLVSGAVTDLDGRGWSAGLLHFAAVLQRPRRAPRPQAYAGSRRGAAGPLASEIGCMDMGNAPAWVAIIVSAVALWTSRRAAKMSTAEARRSADASERSAAVAEEALAEQRRAAEQERVAAAPKVKLVLEAASYGVYRLRNIGNATASRAAIMSRGWPRSKGPPQDLTLRPQEAHEFILTKTKYAHLPSHLWVIYDGLDEATALSVPPDKW